MGKTRMETPTTPEGLASGVDRLITQLITDLGEEIIADTIDDFSLNQNPERVTFMDGLSRQETSLITQEAVRNFYNGFEGLQQTINELCKEIGHLLKAINLPEITQQRIIHIFPFIKGRIESSVKNLLEHHLRTAFETEFLKRRKPDTDEKTEIPSASLGMKVIEGLIKKGQGFCLLVLEDRMFETRKRAFGDSLNNRITAEIGRYLTGNIRTHQNSGFNDLAVYHQNGQYWIILNRTPLLRPEDKGGGIKTAKRIIDELSGKGVTLRIDQQTTDIMLRILDEVKEKQKNETASEEDKNVFGLLMCSLQNALEKRTESRRKDDNGQANYDLKAGIGVNIGCTEFVPQEKISDNNQVFRILKELFGKASRALNAAKAEGTNTVRALR